MSIKFCFRINSEKNTEKENTILEKKDFYLKGDNGSTVMLIHGLTGTPHEMAFLAKALNSKGYSVICPRLANHGLSLDILRKTTWLECYESVRIAFKELDASGNAGMIFTSGLSVGALFALMLTQDFKGKISAVSCLSPTLEYDGWNMPWARHLLPWVYPTPLKNYFYFKEEAPYGIKNEALRKRIHDYYSKADIKNTESVIQYGYPYIPVSLLYQHYLLVCHFKKMIDRIDVPFQCIQARDDDMTSLKNSQFIYEHIKSEPKEIVLLEDSYHVITVDQERDKVAQSMDEFFSKIKLGKP